MGAFQIKHNLNNSDCWISQDKLGCCNKKASLAKFFFFFFFLPVKSTRGLGNCAPCGDSDPGALNLGFPISTQGLHIYRGKENGPAWEWCLCHRTSHITPVTWDGAGKGSFLCVQEGWYEIASGKCIVPFLLQPCLILVVTMRPWLYVNLFM